MWGETKAEKAKREAKENHEKLVAAHKARLLPKYNGNIKFSKNVLSNIFIFFDTRLLIHYRRVSKLWDDALEMTFLYRLKVEVWRDKRFIFNINWLETEEPKFTPFYNEIKKDFGRLLTYKEFLKKPASISKMKELYPKYKKDFKLILEIAIEEVTGFETDKDEKLVEYIGSKEYTQQLDRLEFLSKVRELDLGKNWQSSTLLEATTGILNVEQYCDVYCGAFYLLNKQVLKLRIAFEKHPEYFDRFDQIWIYTKKQRAQYKLIAWMASVVKEKQAMTGPFNFFRRIRFK